MKIFAHIPFIGTSGYANHARSFFTALNKYHTVKVRNFTIGDSWKGMNDTPHDGETYITDEMKNMLVQQTLWNEKGTRTDYNMYGYKNDFIPDVHIVLMETNNYYFYDNYEGYKIAYNVWESTRYPDDFFNRLFYFDEVWVPSQWQYESLIEQGYPKERIFIVPEGVDIETFKPIQKINNKKKFRFLHFGRWDYRKSTTEILKAFSEEFKNDKNVELVCNVENPYPFDGLKTTKERIEKYEIDTSKITFLDFLPRKDYINALQNGDVFLSCARSEGWNLPLIEAMSCGIPSIYSNYGGQLQFAKDKGIPVNISHMRSANIAEEIQPGEYCEPDWDELKLKMRNTYENFKEHKQKAVIDSKKIHEEFNWDRQAQIADKILMRNKKPFAFITTGNVGYMPVIEKLVQSLLEFSGQKIIVYGVDCDVPFDYPNVIKRRINPPKISEHDKWYWKQHACLESLNEEFDYYVWIDGDVVVNYNIDNVRNYFINVDGYPLSDIHVQQEFFGLYDNGRKSQLFNEQLVNEWNIQKQQPYMHVCFFIYNQTCKNWFDELLEHYQSLIEKNPTDYKRLFLWNDEGIDNAMRWKYGYTNHLPLSNFDTSSYDGDVGYIDQTLHQFYKFWNEDGPQNFNRIFGYQYIPSDKSKIIYFHGNKNEYISDKMIEFIKMKRDNSFYSSEHFYTDVYKLENFGDIKDVEGGTMEIAQKYGWGRAIYHEIYNLKDYYHNRIKRINEGDIVVDLGGNIGVFNRWAYSQGATKVISFEPDKRYFKLLSLNSDPRSILFNAAVSDSIGEFILHESAHLGGSSLIEFNDALNKYPVRTYTLDYLFDSGLVDKIDFLKVDIEGAEQHAMIGISDSNLMKVKNISMEYHHAQFNHDEELRDNLIVRLNKLGFNSFLLFCGLDKNLQLIYFWR
jgi:FkbM family methyltransferase